jgi:lipid-A-disaccharide synthase
MLVAAEPSGDALGAALARALKLRRDVRLIGVGGPRMAAEGIESPFDIAPFAVLGVTDALAVYPLVRRRAREIGDLAATERPDVAVLIDSWGFNLRAARAIRQRAPKVKLLKYVGPQVWATRPGRARTLARVVDQLLTIHAFDAPFFEKAGLPTVFVGNPLFGKEQAAPDPGDFRSKIGVAAADPLLLVAPGSRRREVELLLPPFEAAVRELAQKIPSLRIAALVADSVSAMVAERLATWPGEVHLASYESERQDAMTAATAALACSGTVTTELALAGTPMVIAYRLDALTAVVARLLIRTPYITLFNVAAGCEIAPELVQEVCTGPRLAAALAPLLTDPEYRRRQSEAQTAALEIMRGGVVDPAGAAAEAVLASLPG